MKYKFITTGLLLVSLSACSDEFLNVVPETFVTSTTFFQSQADFTQAVNGTYSALRSLYGNAYVMGEMRSDNTHYILKTNDRGPQNIEREQIADFIDLPENQFTANKYNACYSLIARANSVLATIDGVTFDETAKKNLKGQALFLRAFAYFELVQYYGDVPLHLTPVADQSGTALPRSPKTDVYKQLISDATAAAGLLPGFAQQEKGRVTSGSAAMLLGYVHMTLKQYTEAERWLRTVTQAGYSLLPDYASVFDPANKNNAESIFEVQYLQGNQGLQSNFTYQFIPGLTNTSVITGITGNNQTFGGWNTPTDDLLASYESGDKRKLASIAEGYTDAGGVFVKQPFIKKYLHAHAQFNNTNNNWPVYRYADALLLLAECLNEQGKTAQALPFINLVRQRAGLTATSETDQVRLRDEIARERRVELAFENHRWLDLVRTGKAIEVMTAFGVAQKKKFAYLLPQSYSVTANRLLFPIPQRERTLFPDLTQNPGY